MNEITTLDTTATDTALAHYDAAVRELALARRIDEVKEIRDRTIALAHYARMADNRELELDAQDIRVRAERRLGEMIDAEQENGNYVQGGWKPKSESSKKELSLSQAGISKKLSSRAQGLAAMPAAEFEDTLAAARLEGKKADRAIDKKLTAIRRAQPKPPRDKPERQYVSLDQWKGLDPLEQRRMLDDPPEVHGTFTKQESNAIEWAQWSWNPITGCLHDCPYCYARDIAVSDRVRAVYPHGFAPTLRPASLFVPRYMKVPGDAATDGRFRNVFTGSMTDLFGRWVPREWIEAVLREMRNAPDWNFLCLTKFPKRMAEFDIPRNVWMGTTVDLQVRVSNAERAFENVTAGVRWLSVEPMLQPLKFTRLDLFDWVVIGGASASSQTPRWLPPFEWVVDLVAQARAAGCKVYMKTNLLGNRVLELPGGLPIINADPQEVPEVFRYLGRYSEAGGQGQ